MVGETAQLDHTADAEPAPHSIAQSLCLHLLPGLVMTLSFFLTVPLVQWLGLPTNLAFALLTDLLILLPMELGLLFYLARKRGNRGWSLAGIVVYGDRVRPLRLLGWVAVILVPTGFIFAALEPATVWQRQWFDWLPDDLLVSERGYDGDWSRPVLAVTLALNFAFTAVIVPIAEELYFRGYLLPRMPRQFGRAGPVVHSILFSVYHLWTPWMFLVRAVGLLPLIYVTRWTRSVVPGSIAHMLANSVDIIATALDRLR